MLIMIELVSVAIFVICITCWISKWRNQKYNGGVLPPGSMGLPFIGETFQLLSPSYSLDLHSFIKNRIQRFGPIFRSHVAGRPIIFTADNELNHYIFSQERRSVELWYMDSFSKLLVLDGGSRTSGATAYIHKYIRGVYLTHFGSERLKILLNQIQNLVDTTLHSWSAQSSSIEFKTAASNVVTDYTAKILFGYEAEKSSYKLSEGLINFPVNFASFAFNIPGTAFHRALQDKKKLIKILKDVLKERQSSPVKQSEENFMNHLLNDMKKEDFITESFIIQILFSVFFGIAESIPITLTLLIYFLSLHPAVVQELTTEHEAILKNKKEKGLDSSITWEDYKSMTFTLQVINETLRIANASGPGLLRRSLKDIQYKGYTIPAGWTIMVLTSARHMNPEIFDDPIEFNPWRWKELDSITISKNFNPFGGGTRQCVGAEYSRVFLTIFVHVLVTKYRWENTDGCKIHRDPMLRFDDGLHIKLYEKH